MVREVLGMLGRTAEKKPERTGDIRVSIADTRTAETVFGFKAEVGIVEGLARTKDFYDRELQHGRSGIQEGADAAGRPAVGEGSKRQSGGPQTDIG
jgi:hypothetical protein